MLDRNTVLFPLLVGVLGFLLLLPLWSNPGIFWDGWIYHTMIARDNFESGILDAFSRNGRPFSAYIIWFFSNFQHPSWASLIISCAGIAVASIFFYLTLIKLKLLGRLDAAVVSILGTVFPAYQISLSLSSINFQLAIPFFYVAAFLSIASCFSVGFKRFAYSLLAVCFYLVSFSGEATVFLTPFVLALYWLYLIGLGEDKRQSFISTVWKMWWVLATSAVGGIVLFFVFAPYAEYAEVRVSNVSIIALIKDAIRYLKVVIKLEWLPFIIILSGYLYFNKFKKQKLVVNQHYIHVLQLGLFGLFCSAFPYVLGHRHVGLTGWDSRFLMYSGLPIGLICVGIYRLAASNCKDERKAVGLFALLFVFTHVATVWKDSFNWHLRWMRDQQLMQFVEKSVKPDTGLVVIHDKSAPIYGETYRWYELILIVQAALDRDDVIGSSLNNVSALGYDANKHYTEVKKTGWGAPLIGENRVDGCQIIILDSNELYDASFTEKTNVLMTAYLGNGISKQGIKLKMTSQDCPNE